MRFPPITACIGIVITMTSIQPTVMYRPNYRDITFCQIVKQDSVVQEIPMYIMYMYNIWIYSLYFANERTCYHTGCQTMPIRHSRYQSMPGHIKPVPYRHQFGRTWLYAIPAIAISDIALPAISHRQLSNLLHNTPCRRISTNYRIYL